MLDGSVSRINYKVVTTKLNLNDIQSHDGQCLKLKISPVLKLDYNPLVLHSSH